MVTPIRCLPLVFSPPSRPRPRLVPALAALSVLGAAATAGPSSSPMALPVLEADFSPGVTGSLRARVAREIRGARESLEVALYTGMTVETALELSRASRAGRRVRVLVDAEAGIPDESARARGKRDPRWKEILVEAGIPVRTLPPAGATGPDRPAFHHKFAVVDAGTVLTGSWNWSARGDGSNYENLVVIRDAPFARRFAEEFERLWTAAGVERADPGAEPPSRSADAPSSEKGRK